MALAACRFPQQAVPDEGETTRPPSVGANTLGTNDLLEVRVYGEADLTGVYRVAPEGFIDFPLCGKVKVVGLTPTQAADSLTGCLKQGFLRRPQVSVLVKEFNSKKVFVFGEVTKPGSFSYEEGMTIIHAVSQAGGLTRTASKNTVNVTRVLDGREVKVPVSVEDIVQGHAEELRAGARRHHLRARELPVRPHSPWKALGCHATSRRAATHSAVRAGASDGGAASTSPTRTSSGAPSMRVITPPASWTSSAAPAMSHGLRPSSKKPSRRPAAT